MSKNFTMHIANFCIHLKPIIYLNNWNSVYGILKPYRMLPKSNRMHCFSLNVKTESFY